MTRDQLRSLDADVLAAQAELREATTALDAATKRHDDALKVAIEIQRLVTEELAATREARAGE